MPKPVIHLESTESPNFGPIFVTQLASVLAGVIVKFAIGMDAWQQSQSASAVSWVLLSSFLPGIVASPFAGVLVDRFPKVRLLALTEFAALLATLAIWVLNKNGLLSAGALYGFLALLSLMHCFQFPALSVLVTRLVPKDRLFRTNSLLQMSDSVAHVLGPVLGAMLLTAWTLDGVFAVNFALSTVALVLLLTRQLPPEPLAHEGRPMTMLADMAEGIRYLRDRRDLLALLGVLLLGNFLLGFPLSTLVPTLLSQPDSQPIWASLAEGAVAAGAATCALLVTLKLWAGSQKHVRSIAVGIALQGAALVAFGFGSNLAWWCICMAIVGFSMDVVMAANQSLWQSVVPPELQGRVFSVRRQLAQLASPLSIVLAGLIADRYFGPFFHQAALFPDWVVTLVRPGQGAGLRMLAVASGLGLLGLAAYALRSSMIQRLQTPDKVFEERPTSLEVSASAK